MSAESRPPRRRKPARRTAKESVPPHPFETHYPNVVTWVQDGYIEVGWDDMSRSFVRALDAGGMVWEGKRAYASVDEALAALDAGIAEWMAENR